MKTTGNVLGGSDDSLQAAVEKRCVTLSTCTLEVISWKSGRNGKKREVGRTEGLGFLFSTCKPLMEVKEFTTWEGKEGEFCHGNADFVMI